MAAPSITTDQWLEAAAYRRTVYGLKDTSAVSDDRIEAIVKKVLDFAPSSYNTQPARITLILGEKHKAFWDVIINTAKPHLEAAGAWDVMEGRFAAFRNAYGSVVFWDSNDTIKETQNIHKSSAHMFEQWAEHASGIYQILTWTALELEGLGANLQHARTYPGVEEALRKHLGVPESWTLRANLNFGDKAQPHPEKPAKLPLSETLTVLK